MIKFFADGTSDFSTELAQKYDVGVIPLFINLDGEYYRDRIEIDPMKIFEWSDRTEQTPKTAAPSIEDVTEAFRPYAQKGDDIFYFAISEDMSTSANVARLAAAELDYEEHVFVVDSMSLSSGIALLLIKAKEMADEGVEPEVIYNRIKDLRSKVRVSFVVDTLTFLHRGGRCSSTAKLFGNALKLKPRIDVVEGKMVATTKYRGSNGHVILHYVDDLKEQLLNADPSRVFISHSPCDGEIIDMVQKSLEEMNYFDEIIEVDASGVICSHCGPGCLGVLFIDK